MIDLTLEEYMQQLENDESVVEDFQFCIYPENKHLHCESCGYCEKYISYDVNIAYD
jgi:hypothetical protein